MVAVLMATALSTTPAKLTGVAALTVTNGRIVATGQGDAGVQGNLIDVRFAITARCDVHRRQLER